MAKVANILGLVTSVDLGYLASPLNGIVTNTGGTDATIPLADSVNAGLMSPGDFDYIHTIITQTITDGDTTHTPSGDAVFDALALKANDNAVIHKTGDEVKTGNLTVNQIIKAGGTSSQFLKADGSSDSTVYAPLNSPTFTGDPKAPTPAPGDNDTSVANTAFVVNAIGILDSNVVHKTLDETINDTKTFINSGDPSIVINNANSGGISGLLIGNTSSGFGAQITNSGAGAGLNVQNLISATQPGFLVEGFSTSTAASIISNTAGLALSVTNPNNGAAFRASTSGGGVVVTANSIAPGINFMGQNNGSTTFTVNHLGAVTGNSFIKQGGTPNQFLKADGSVDSSIYALDSNVLHKTTDESWTGVKSSVNTGATLINGLFLTNNGSAGSKSLQISNTAAGTGIDISNIGTGIGLKATTTAVGGIAIQVLNNNTSTGIDIQNTTTGSGLTITNSTTGNGILVSNTTNGLGFVSNLPVGSTGFNFVGREAGVNTFTVDELGNINAKTFVKAGGLPTEFLMANGTVSVGPFELAANKQNSLVYNGTGIKFPTVDAVNNLTREISKFASKTGLISKLDTFDLTAFSTTTLRIAPVASAVFWNELFVASTSPVDAYKSFAQKDYVLTQLVTATGGNVNVNPIVADGKHIRYIGYDKNGNVYSSGTSLASNNDILQLGVVTVLKVGAAVTFLDGTVGPRNVLAIPNLASNTDFDKIAGVVPSITVSPNSAASLATANGSLRGISINWKGSFNPSNNNPIDVFNYIGVNPVVFTSINPLFLTSTAAITTHTLWTESEGGILVNERFFNTTTQLPGTMAAATASVKRILVGIRGSIYIQDGEHPDANCYPDLTTAKNNIFAHKFSDAITPPGTAFEIARVAYVKGATVFTNDTQFYIVNTASGSTSSSTVIPPVPDATTTTKGILKLAGDFDPTSTADTPIIKDATTLVRGVVNTTTQSFAGNKTFTGNITANSIIKLGGTSSQFLKADGSIDSTSYLPATGGTGYIQNQNAVDQSANFRINGTGQIGNNLTITSNTATLKFTPTSGQTGIGSAGVSALAFYAGAASETRMSILQTGNVGIGTTSPASLFQVGGFNNIWSQTNGSANIGYALWENAPNAFAYTTASTIPTLYSQLAGTHKWLSATTTGVVNAAVTMVQRMVIDSSGNTAIGPLAPTSKLDVNGTITSTITGNPTFLFNSTDTNVNNRNWDLISNLTNFGDFDLRNSTGANIAPSVSRIKVKSDGRVGIGLTSPIGILNINTGLTTTYDLANQANGSISFANGGTGAIPTITGKSDTNRGLFLTGGTVDINTLPDMEFNVRQNDNNDFLTLTSTAFRFARLAVPLLEIFRDGKTTISSNYTGASTDVLTLINPNATANTETTLFFKPTSTTDNSRGAKISAVNDGSNNIALKFFTGAGATIAERMRIGPTGNVGIDVVPTNKLEVKIATADGTLSSSGVAFHDGAVNKQQIAFGVNTSSLYSWIQSAQVGVAYKNLILNPHGGNVGIGTTAPSNKLEVREVASTTGLFVNNLNDFNANVVIASNVGKLAQILFQKNVAGIPKLRWGIRSESDAESGSNIGSDLRIASYDDTGTFLFDTFVIQRNNGFLRFVQTPTTSAGTYDFLTRNTSTGVIEKMASGSVPTGSGTPNKVVKWLTASTQTDSTITDTSALITLGAAGVATAGNIGIKTASNSNSIGIYMPGVISGGINAYGIYQLPVIQSDVTSSAVVNRSIASTVAAAFTLPHLAHFEAAQGTIGAGSAITAQYGFNAQASLVGATNNYGFYGAIPSGTGRWNTYMVGTADNYFAGDVGIGIATPDKKLEVIGDGRFTKDIVVEYPAGGGVFAGTTNNYLSKLAGNAPDFNSTVILLHPIYVGVNITHYECKGRISVRRGSSSASLRDTSINIETATALNENHYFSEMQGGNTNAYSLVTCDYLGVKYVALKFDAAVDASARNFGFDGYIQGDANALLAINYFVTNTSTVLNAEVNGSIAAISYNLGKVINSLATTINSPITVIPNGDVGIGTASPSEILHLKDSAPVLRFEKTGVLNWKIGNITGNDFVINTDAGGGNAVTILATNGNVGIRTTNPLYPLDVTTAVGGGVALSLKGQATGNTIGMAYFNSSGSRRAFVGFGTTSSSLFSINNEESGGHISLGTIGTGNVGIGTTTPTEKLHVSGNALIGENTTASTVLAVNGTAATVKSFNLRSVGLNRWGLRLDNTAESAGNLGSDFRLSSYNDAGSFLSDILFVKRSTGNVGIGTTNLIGRLTVNVGLTAFTNDLGSMSFGTVSLGNDSITSSCAPVITGKSNDSVGLTLMAGTADANPSYDMRFNVRRNDNVDFSSSEFTRPAFTFTRYNTTLFTILRNGNSTFTGTVTATGGFFNSDARLKDIISRNGDMVTFRWKDKRDDKTHIGYIAQEVQETIPDAIQEGEDGMLSVNYIEVLIKKIADLEADIRLLKSKLN